MIHRTTRKKRAFLAVALIAATATVATLILIRPDEANETKWDTAENLEPNNKCSQQLDVWATKHTDEAKKFLDELRNPETRTDGNWWTYNQAIEVAPDEFANVKEPIGASRRRQIIMAIVYRQYLYGIPNIDRDGVVSQTERDLVSDCLDTGELTGIDFFNAKNTRLLNSLSDKYGVDPKSPKKPPEPVLLAMTFIAVNCGQASQSDSVAKTESTGLGSSEVCVAVNDYLDKVGQPVLPEPTPFTRTPATISPQTQQRISGEIQSKINERSTTTR